MHNRRELLVILLIIILAAVFRFNDLGSIPTQLNPGEANIDQMALQDAQSPTFNILSPQGSGVRGLFVHLVAWSYKIFDRSLWSLRFVSALFGILTVYGIYLLSREIFSQQIAVIASVFLASSLSHVTLSRIASADVLGPFCFILGTYFLWLGLKKLSYVYFVYAGIMLGIGFHTHPAFGFTLIASAVTLLTYWLAMKNDFSHEKYAYTRRKIYRGLIIAVLLVAVILIPLLYNTQTSLGSVSVVSNEDPLSLMLFWPVGLLFIIGLIKSFIKLFKTVRSHGHPSSAQALILAWFFSSLLPIFFSDQRTIIFAIPAACIIAAEGLWWVFEKLDRWYAEGDKHNIKIYPHTIISEHALISRTVVIIFLAAIVFAEYYRYFN